MSANDKDLANLYPSLSEDQDKSEEEVNNKIEENGEKKQGRDEKEYPESQPHKIIKTNEGEANVNLPAKACLAPPIFGGRVFAPPPPPPGAKKYIPPPAVPMPPPPPTGRQSQSNQGENQQRPQMQGPRPERKNCIYVRNIPKHYNQSDKLMTFFKNEGQIKEIKVNHEESSAMVRFVKEENAMRFVNSKKAIFNRSFITYSFNEKQVVSPQLVKEREDDESGKIKKPVEIQMREIRQRVENILVVKIRAMLFLKKYLPANSQHLAIAQTILDECIYLKNNFPKYSYQQMVETSRNITNEYDWTVKYSFRSTTEMDKKQYMNVLLKNHGPVSDVDLIDCTAVQPEMMVDPEGIQAPTIFDYTAKVTFLSPKHAWLFYSKPHQRQEKDLKVQGSAMRQIFNEGMLTVPSLHQTIQEYPEIQQLVEISENGEVRILDREQDKPEEAEEIKQPQESENGQHAEGEAVIRAVAAEVVDPKQVPRPE